MLYIVLGMHKSGTTLVSETLHRSGIVMGEGADVEGGYDDGTFFERSEFRGLNQAMIGLGDPAELYPTPTRPRATPDDRAQMRALIAKAETSGADWGFKDPRTCLTYGLWSGELPAHKIVAVYRHLSDVWGHYARRRRRPPARRVVRSWCEYNAGLIGILEATTAPAIVLRYESLMTDPHELERLSGFIGRPAADVRRPDLHRSRPPWRLHLAAFGAARACIGRAWPGPVTRALVCLHRASIESVATREPLS